jgi:hypothetical protein
MSTTIPYEDAQTAANQIAQCTSNVLTVIFPSETILLSNEFHYILGNQWTITTTNKYS